MDFVEALEALGFRPSDERRIGRNAGSLYTATPNRYMSYMVHVYGDGTALFTWEFAIADYLASFGIQVGSSEALNQYLYPREDLRGPQEASWLGGAIDATERTLAAVRLDSPDPVDAPPSAE
jgi:hypothetical protein